MDDATLGRLIAQFAVLEQTLINLAHMVTAEYEDPVGLRAAMFRDVRERFLAMAERAETPAVKTFAAMALVHADRFEPRFLGDTAGHPTQ